MEPVQDSRDYARRRLPAAQPHSPEEMFLRLLDHGARAREAGNYGIAAACVVRHAGRELVCFGRSTMFGACDPGGHAEMNALRGASRLGRADGPELDALLADTDAVLTRPAPHDRTETVLYTTLEPCPMCTVAILNSGIDEVVVACADEFGGALLRLETLAPLWGELAESRGMAVRVLGAGDVPDELLDRLRSLFFDTKEPLDRRLEASGVLPGERLRELASRRP